MRAECGTDVLRSTGGMRRTYRTVYFVPRYSSIFKPDETVVSGGRRGVIFGKKAAFRPFKVAVGLRTAVLSVEKGGSGS
ncbi:hypothetical protein Ato02nite_048520 [Paractinoplanes toevensis]|uniref:Uncharacterized protein n=1 Tax=Paractinoplanes toevensis TaxID=571911 RepID=A0A919TFA2_9ACTN|nr:hypothetical protein Ato02nite_048520 [Actinoplanes toevensis]